MQTTGNLLQMTPFCRNVQVLPEANNMHSRSRCGIVGQKSRETALVQRTSICILMVPDSSTQTYALRVQNTGTQTQLNLYKHRQV